MLARPLLDVQCMVAAASVLVLASGCEVARAPHAQAPAAVQQAASPRPVPPVANAEADYLKAKHAYIASLAVDEARGTPDSAREQTALRDLADRLRSILGPFRARGFSGDGTSNMTTLIRQMDFGALDGIVHESSDSTWVLATTRTLLTAWLRDSVAGDTAMPHDPATALTRQELYTDALQGDAMVLRYANIPVDSAVQSGVVAAMLIGRGQDFVPLTPNQILVSVMRGDHVYVAVAPARALIPPMSPCVAIWNEAQREEDSVLAAYRSNPTDTTAKHPSPDISQEGDAAGRRCYAEHVTTDPGFAILVQQVRFVVRRLPPQ